MYKTWRACPGNVSSLVWSGSSLYSTQRLAPPTSESQRSRKLEVCKYWNVTHNLVSYIVVHKSWLQVHHEAQTVLPASTHCDHTKSLNVIWQQSGCWNTHKSITLHGEWVLCKRHLLLNAIAAPATETSRSLSRYCLPRHYLLVLNTTHAHVFVTAAGFSTLGADSFKSVSDFDCRSNCRFILFIIEVIICYYLTEKSIIIVDTVTFYGRSLQSQLFVRVGFHFRPWESLKEGRL